MKRSRFVPLASAILLLLAAGAALAGNPQPQNPDPEALLEEIFAQPATETAPAASEPCVAWGVCRLCSDGIRRQPCIATRCGTGPVTYSGCGSCTTNCVPPNV